MVPGRVFTGFVERVERRFSPEMADETIDAVGAPCTIHRA
jgi:hypothetical protein